ncbi:hypothetical protein B0O80DRAFT_504722 [Mortierella sp. GBAus27b]|nr:hypothetical protein B0O80DRAFT_504722 [Mortierella sp. GBAus27b]
MASFKDFIARFKSALSKNKAAVTVLETPDIETIASEFPNVDANNYATVSDKMYTILYSKNGAMTKGEVENTARASLDLHYFKDFIARFKSALSKNKAAVTVLETPDIETIASEFPNVDANNYATVSDKMYTILYSKNGAMTKGEVENTARASLDLH